MADPIFTTAQGVNRETFQTGTMNVAAAGTAVQLGTQDIPDGYSVVIRAKVTNTKQIYFANSQANAQNHAVAAQLGPDDYIALFISNTKLVWIDADVNGEGVTWAVESTT